MLKSNSAVLRRLALVRTHRFCNTFSWRYYSTLNESPHGKSVAQRYNWVFTTVCALGISALCGGIAFNVYNAMTTWPPALRQDLRTALKKKHAKDYNESESCFRRAWATAKALPPSELDPLPYLKTTGIAIALGSMLESIGRLDRAYDVYSEALSHLQDAGSKQPLSIEEQMRAVTLSCKLAEMANAMGRGDVEEEKWLVWAVEVILKNMPEWTNQNDATWQKNKPFPDHESLELPEWVSATDLATPFEALGTLYVRIGRDEYALPLFLQAVSFLAPRTSSGANRCRGAQTMSSISDLIIRINPGNHGITQAESWSRKALDITTDTRNKLREESGKWLSRTPERDPTCELALAVSLYNIGVLRMMIRDKEEATRFLKMSIKQSRSIGLKQGIVAGEKMLRHVEQDIM